VTSIGNAPPRELPGEFLSMEERVRRFVVESDPDVGVSTVTVAREFGIDRDEARGILERLRGQGELWYVLMWRRNRPDFRRRG
jgi:hypothetical protein